MKNFLGWMAESSIAQNYINSINLILSSDNNFNNFRGNNSGYQSILEHLTKNDGQIYAKYILNNYPDMLNHLDVFKLNDSVGNPALFNYDNFGLINPTTLRYVKFFGDIQKEFGDLNNFNLVEIGGGYGGLVRILASIFNFKSIKMFDLPEVLLLQKRYLDIFNINVETYTYEDDFQIFDNTIVVSNYAWCECDKKTRGIYMDKIIKRSKYVYMVVYGIDVDNELMILEGEKKVLKETLNDCKIFTLKGE